MPLPKPKDDETQSEFVGRCAGSKSMQKEFPDQQQRVAVCYNQWRTANKSGSEEGMSDDLKAKHRLSQLWVREITLCQNPAVPDATFAVIKHDGAPDGQEPVVKASKILKIDDDKKQVFGYVLVPDRVDSQGDVISKAEIEKAAHRFMQMGFDGTVQGDGTGLEHQFFTDIGRPIESAIDTYGAIGKSHGIESVPGAWWVGVRVTNDGVWKSIKDGSLTGFSIGAYGNRQAIAKATMLKPVQAFIDRIKNLTAVAKEESFSEVYTEAKFYEEIDLLFASLRSAMWSILWDEDVKDKGAAIAESVDQFKKVVVGYADLMKATGAMHVDGPDTDDIVCGLNKAIENIHALITDVTKGGKAADSGGTMSNTEIQELTELVKATADKVDMLVTDVDELKKAKGTTDPNADPNANPDGDDKVDIEKAVGDLTAQVGELVKKVDGLVTDVGVLKKAPNARTGDEPATKPDAGGGGKKTEIEKTADGTPVPPANTGLSFRRTFDE
jgi:methyl-accepting chemotaxis protein